MSGSGRGDVETVKLRTNIEDQLNRLLTQLQDIEDMKDDMSIDEYTSSRSETIDQMKEFEVYLQKLLSGNMSLIDQFGSVQLAIQSAIRDAFQSPEVVRMFAKKENGALRGRLRSLEEDLKLGRLSQTTYSELVCEVLLALQKLGEVLDAKEKNLLDSLTKNMSAYTRSNDETVSSSIIETAASETRKYK